MRGALSRLRWQLTLSHLVAIAVTLVSMIAAVLFIVSAWWTHASDPSFQPAEDARTVAATIAPLVRTADATHLNDVLGLLAHGQLALGGVGASAPEVVRSRAPVSSELTNLTYIVVVGLDGHVIGSSDASLSGPGRSEWSPLVDAALTGATDVSRLSIARSGLGAYPVFDTSGQPIAATVVALSALPTPSTPWDLWQALLFFGAATLAVLLGASVFALASSSLVSYVLSRRMVRRLELLGHTAEQFAMGDLTPRVPDTAQDEVGELGRRFNAMADRLSSSLAELAAEKHNVETTLQAKRELVANVSHELRTPLASIRAHTESLLLRDPDEGDRRRYLQVIHRQTEQLSRLIDDLFLLATTEAGALPLVTRPLGLPEVIDEVVSSVQPAALQERQVRLFSDVSPDLPPVAADRQRVAQVLANLVRNAVRHTPPGGMVAVRARRHDRGFGMVLVEDTGQGIPSEELLHVFERFYRIDGARDRGSGGAGLGLAIVRELVTAMGGEVAAESVVGEGSRFSFTLPFA